MPTSLAQVLGDYQAIDFSPPPALNQATVNTYLALDPAVVVSAIENEAYTQNDVNPVIREYQAAFGRVPDQAGEAYWVHQFGTGAASLTQISTIFASAPEFSTLYGGAGPTTPANTALVTAFYQNVLQRAPDAAGLAFWTNSGLNAAQLLQAFSQAPEAVNTFALPIINYENLEAAGTPPVTGSLFAIPIPGPTFTLTTGPDNIQIGANNSTVIGTGNGAGATFTVNDIINGGTHTGNIFDLSDLGAGPGIWAATSVFGVTVSGIQTANLVSATDAVTADFTGAQGWTGLTQANVTSADNGANVDAITAAATTAVLVSDSVTAAVTANLTVTGGSTVAITEANNFGDSAHNIVVNGGLGTTTVSVTQTETAVNFDQQVQITDVNFAAGTALGTITAVTLNGLDHTSSSFSNINDSALATLTIDNAGFAGASTATTDVFINAGTFATPSTTLTLNVNNDVASASGLPILHIHDTNAEFTTLTLAEGNSNSTVALDNFNGLTSVTLAGAGTGVLTATFNDAVTSAVNFDFSATTVNGDTFTVARGAAGDHADVFTLGNAGTVLHPESLTITNSDLLTNTDTINFGSGENTIIDAAHTTGAHAYVNTAATGTSSVTTFSNITQSGAPTADTLTFKGDTVTSVAVGAPGFATVAAGVQAELFGLNQHEAGAFTVAGNTFVFDHASAGTGATTLGAADSLVEITGAHTLTSVAANHILFA